jgi:hypothetical protein
VSDSITAGRPDDDSFLFDNTLFELASQRRVSPRRVFGNAGTPSPNGTMIRWDSDGKAEANAIENCAPPEGRMIHFFVRLI